MWISVRKSASPTLQPSQDPEQHINKKCATSPGRVCTSAWRARCRSDARTCLRCSHTRSPAIMAGWVVTSYSLFCSRTWRPETKTVGTHVELEMMGWGGCSRGHGLNFSPMSIEHSSVIISEKKQAPGSIHTILHLGIEESADFNNTCFIYVKK